MKLAAVHADLPKVLLSGPAPDVAILPPALGGSSAQDLVDVEARIADKGKGIGRVEIVFHPARLPAPLPGEDLRHCVQRETEALAAVIKSAL